MFQAVFTKKFYKAIFHADSSHSDDAKTLYSNTSCIFANYFFINTGAKIGDFVEIKNSVIGEGTAVAHLTYVGDSDVGAYVNFGCGVVTVNYDGEKKSRCTIEDNSFIGCNTNLVAPVTVGKGAYTAAGSTITRDVPPDALAIERAKLEMRELINN